MVVGVIGWELEIFGCQSLKEKRSVVKSLKERMRNRFNVSVAETGHTELWQRAEITACVVSSDRRLCDSVLESVDRFVQSDARARVIRAERSFL
ncbi:MAG: DUF503 domain-containing protein [Gemmatimonadetes bacterium]|nr:DUF503 domain-containing protein [Gemmatimonadota bacterium]